MGSQHPSPNVKMFCNFEPQIWPEVITSRDAKCPWFEGLRTSCDVINLGVLGQILPGARSHHVMDVDGCFLLIAMNSPMFFLFLCIFVFVCFCCFLSLRCCFCLSGVCCPVKSTKQGGTR